MDELVVLVDTNDTPVGTMEKLMAHTTGSLHRAISVFIFNSKGEMLLQQRASSKYHSADLWTNTCCSHPRPEESVYDAATRRLMEEMGMSCELHKQFSFVYRAEFSNELTEHEYDHVFTGVSDATPTPNPDEVQAWKYLSKEALLKDIQEHPDSYTEWFKICIAEHTEQVFGQ